MNKNLKIGAEGRLLIDCVFSIYKKKDNLITFREECDQWFSLTVDKKEAIEILRNCIKYIENKGE